MTDGERAALEALAGHLEAQAGWALPNAQLPTVAAKLARLPQILSVSSLGQVVERALNDPMTLRERIIPALTVGETYFFRNQAQFDALSARVLPALRPGLQLASRRLVVWVAGCATGEEAYSVAIWLREQAPELWPARVRVVATDIDRDFLGRARDGLYRPWSFRRATGGSWQGRYFSREGDGSHRVDDSLRQVVRFQEHNLVSGALPTGLGQGTADLVLCRNVLIYFSPRAAEAALALFRAALTPDGVLMLGHAEAVGALTQWRATYHPGTFFYQPPAPVAAQPAPKPSSRPLASSVAATPAVQPRMPRPASAELLARAREHADAGALAEAHQMLVAYSAKHKTSAEAYLLTAIVAEELGDLGAARDALSKALFLDRTLLVAHFSLAVIAERYGDLAEALRRYRTVCRLARDERVSALDLPFARGVSASRLAEIAQLRVRELDSEASARAAGRPASSGQGFPEEE